MKFTVCLAALCCIMLVLSDQFQGSTAIRKKKIFKKLKEFLPLLLALKGKKKIPLLIPIPIPIRVHAKKQSWPTAPAWPSSLPALSWPSSLPESISWNLPELNSWSPQQPSAVKTTHSFLPADYISDPSLKQQQGAKNEILTSYFVNNGPGLDYALNTQQKGGSNLYNNIYNAQAVSSAYNGDSYLNTNIENRRPVLQKINKPIKKPLFGQPISNPIDDYENGKGSAPIYNDEGSKVAARSPATYSDSPVSNNNKVQFQTTSVNSDYNDASSYADNANNINSNNEYKIQNEISNEDNRLKSVSGDYLGDSNQGDNYEKSNELIDENVKDQPTYYSNSVPAVRLEGYKKAKV